MYNIHHPGVHCFPGCNPSIPSFTHTHTYTQGGRMVVVLVVYIRLHFFIISSDHLVKIYKTHSTAVVMVHGVIIP